MQRIVQYVFTVLFSRGSSVSRPTCNPVFNLPWNPCRLALSGASQQRFSRLVLGYGNLDGHVVDYALHTDDVGDELGDQVLFGGVLGLAT